MKNLHFSAVVAGRRQSFQIIAKSWSTRNSWGHEADLYINDRPAGSDRVRYYNRTWERWQYESICMNLLYDYAERYADRLLEDYRTETGRKRIDAATRAKITRPAERIKKRLYAHLQKANNSAW